MLSEDLLVSLSEHEVGRVEAPCATTSPFDGLRVRSTAMHAFQTEREMPYCADAIPALAWVGFTGVSAPSPA